MDATMTRVERRRIRRIDRSVARCCRTPRTNTKASRLPGREAFVVGACWRRVSPVIHVRSRSLGQVRFPCGERSTPGLAPCVWSLRQPLPSVAGCDLHRTYRNTRARSANFFAHHIATTYASQGLRRFVLMSVDARQRCLNVAYTATQRAEERRSKERVHVHR